jgi:hypothetical protein
MASTARASHNSDAAKSEKTPVFSLRELVESSTWPALYRALLLAMLDKNRFGTELFRSQRKLSREFCVSYSTIRRMIDRLERGHRFGRTQVNHCEGVLTLLYEPNKRPGGKLRRTPTYQLHPQRFQPRMTEQEFEDRSNGALCPFPPNSTRPSSPPPPPSPPVKQPAEDPHRSQRREAHVRELNSRDGRNLVKYMLAFSRGNVREVGLDGLASNLSPGHPRYAAPMNKHDALIEACKKLGLPLAPAKAHLEMCGWKFDEPPPD